MIHLVEIDAYDPLLPGLRTLRFSSGQGYAAETGANLLAVTGKVDTWGGSTTKQLNAVTAPDGTQTAQLLTATSTTNAGPGYNIGNAGFTTGSPHKFGVYFRRIAGTYSWVRLRVAVTSGVIASAFYDIENGLVGGVTPAPSGDITLFRASPAVRLTGGWWYLPLDLAANSTSVNVSAAPATGNDSALMVIGDQWSLWGAQLVANPGGAYYEGRVQDPGNFQRAIYSPGSTSGDSTVGVGEVVIANPDGELDPMLDYGIAGREVRVWTIPDESGPFPAAARWATGTAEQVEVSWTRVTVRLRDRLELLRRPIQATLYAGTTVAGGMAEAEGMAEDLKGQPKPLLFGAALNIPAIQANSFDLIFQVSDGPISSIDAVYDAGAPLLFSANYASVAALRSASIQGGYYATCTAQGLFRIGSSPFGQITCDATEGATPASRTAAQVAYRICLRGGLLAADFNPASITGLDVDNSAETGIWISDEMEVLEAANTVLQSVGGWLLPNRNGVFEVGRLEAPSSPIVATYTEEECLDRGAGIERIATGDQGAGVPTWKVTLRYARNWATQGSADLAGCVAAARRTELAQEYRTVVVEDAAVKTIHPLATELTVDTLLTEPADALAEANRLLSIYKVRRDRLIVPLDATLAAPADLGRTITMQFSRWGYNAGRPMVILGMTENAVAGITELDIWG